MRTSKSRNKRVAKISCNKVAEMITATVNEMGEGRKYSRRN